MGLCKRTLPDHEPLGLGICWDCFAAKPRHEDPTSYDEVKCMMMAHPHIKHVCLVPSERFMRAQRAMFATLTRGAPVPAGFTGRRTLPTAEEVAEEKRLGGYGLSL